jgi:hypothetical protein
MLTAQQAALLSVVIALAALLISFLSLWRTHFSRPRPIVVCGRLRQRIYPIRNEQRNWYLASFDLPLSFLNPGAQPVLVTGIRLRLHFPKIPIPGNGEILSAKWEIAPADAERIDRERFKWIREIRPVDFMPFAILPRQTLVKALILETRWDEPVVADEVDATLEWRLSSGASWRKGAAWKMNLDRFHWSELANVGTSMSYAANGAQAQDDQLVPKDLHKYTGTKDPIPEDGFATAPSHLSYPKDRKV